MVRTFISQGKTQKNAGGWDFGTEGGLSSTGTVRSVVRPPQARDRKPDIPLNQAASRKNLDNRSQWSSASGTVTYNSSEVSSWKDPGDAYSNEKQDSYSEDVCFPSLSLSLPLLFMHLGFCVFSPCTDLAQTYLQIKWFLMNLLPFTSCILSFPHISCLVNFISLICRTICLQVGQEL